MYISKLRIKNLRGIVHLEESFDKEDIIKATGKNGAGKSSFIDSIMLALKGGRYFTTGKGQKYSAAEIINFDADSAEVELELIGEKRKLIIKRRVLKNGRTQMSITSSDGESIGQEHLDGLLNALTIDPVSLSHCTPMQQIEALKPLLPDNINIVEMEEKAKKHEIERHIADKELSALYGQQKKEEPEYQKNLNISDLLSEHTILVESQKEIIKFKERIESINLNITQKRENIFESEERVKKAKDLILELNKSISDKKEDLESLEQERINMLTNQPEDKQPQINAIKAKIDQAEIINHKANKYNNWLEEQEKLNARRKDLQNLSTESKQKRDAIKSSMGRLLSEAGEGVPLYWDSDGGLVIRDTRFAEMSTSEKVLAGAWFSSLVHKKKKDNKLDMLIIRNASNIDSTTMKKMKSIAHNSNLQLILEIVEDNKELEIIIEES